MSKSICIPCQNAVKLLKAKVPFLMDKAKQRAIESGQYKCLFYDEEDKKIIIKDYEQVKESGLESFITDIISPYLEVTA